MRRPSDSILLLSLAFVLPSTLARANGLEAPTSASAKYSALGGAAASSVTGADSVLLNPAGLAHTDGLQLVVNFQPVYNKTSAPLSAPNDSASSRPRVAPLAEILAAYQLAKGLAFGAGISAAGGLGADYGNVAFGDYSMKPPVSQTIGSVEASLGLGYLLTEHLSIGAAWRASFTRGDIQSAAPGPNGMLQALDVSGASGSSLTGFRFGAQYQGGDGKWGFGVMVRTPVVWALTGQGSVSLSNASVILPTMPIGPVSTKFNFPLQVAAGAHAEVLTNLTIHAQYSWSKYSSNQYQELTLGGMQTDLPIDWKDRHTAQLGAEYRIGAWALRAGYIFESSVVPRDRPSIYAPPAPANTVGIGTGFAATDALHLDAAVLLSLSSGNASPAADAGALPGTYRNDSYVMALSGSYLF